MAASSDPRERRTASPAGLQTRYMHSEEPCPLSPSPRPRGPRTPAARASPLDGPRTVEYRSTDLLGNVEPVRTLQVILDKTPPATAISASVPPFPADARFALSATDAGSGVDRTEYRIDGGPWIPYTTPFAVPGGAHVIGYLSVDNLGNTEGERTLTVPAEVVLPVEFNWKPLVAAVFTVVLLAAGAWSSRRAPWKVGRGRRAALKALAVFGLPFVVLEAGTGVVSLLTGLLSIPPVLGPGTAVDLAILAAGLAMAAYRGVRARAPDSGPVGR